MTKEEFERALELARENAKLAASGTRKPLVPMRDECRIYYITWEEWHEEQLKKWYEKPKKNEE